MAEIHPLFIVGVITFAFPFVAKGILRWDIPGWVGIIGLILLVFGVILSIFDGGGQQYERY